FAANVGEDQQEDLTVGQVEEQAKTRGARLVKLSGRMEAEISALEPGERAEYLRELGMGEPGLVRLIRTAYELLGLITFFTAVETESRACTVRKGTKAATAAGLLSKRRPARWRNSTNPSLSSVRPWPMTISTRHWTRLNPLCKKPGEPSNISRIGARRSSRMR